MDFEKAFLASVDVVMPRVDDETWKVFCALLRAGEPIGAAEISHRTGVALLHVADALTQLTAPEWTEYCLIDNTKSIPIRYVLCRRALNDVLCKHEWRDITTFEDLWSGNRKFVCANCYDVKEETP